MWETSENTIIIGTKNLTEQKIVANMIKEVVERDTDLKVEIKSGMDTTSFVHSAIINNDIDMYVEYSSVSFLEIFKQTYTGQTPETIISYIKQAYQTEYQLEWITTLGFDNSNALLCSEFCTKNNITTYSDLQNYTFKFGAPAYFYERSDGYNLLQDNYQFANNVKTKKLDPIMVYIALQAQDIDVGLGFTTDAKLTTTNLNILQDDQNIFPKYDAGIVVSSNCLQKHPELEKILKKFNNSLNNEIIQQANEAVENKGISVKEEAHKLVNRTNL
ncbi:MAG: glycine betaine ABC transporter substrate-binding protein [Mycoplasmatales bacterium]